MMLIVLALAFLVVSFSASFASEIEVGAKFCGEAKVADGDDLVVGAVEFRLFGIDAYEHAQDCKMHDGARFDLGAATLSKIEELVKGKVVCCVVDHLIRGRGPRRPVGRCMVGDVDVAEYMVLSGFAVDCPRFSLGRYSEAEAEARQARKGGWACSPHPEKPWDFKKAANYCAPR